MATTGPSHPSAATRTAAATAVPDDPPTSSPSSWISQRPVANDSSSLTRSTASITPGSHTDGITLPPIPSTR